MAPRLTCPLADQSLRMPTRGRYRKGYPEGLVVHFTAGQCDTDQQMKDSIAWGIDNRFAFFGIAPSGKLFQTHSLDTWGSHAGTSNWPGVGSSVSQYFLGVEIAAAGTVDKNRKSWFGKTFSEDRLRRVEAKANMKAGNYVKYTAHQEQMLIQLCVWLHENNPTVFKIENIVGHDEIAPLRKNDPGGALSMTMPEFRLKIQAMIKERSSQHAMTLG